MPEETKAKSGAERHEREMTETVSRKAERRVNAQRKKEHSIWFGMGMFGLVGWTIAIPTVAGLALGLWIDKRWPSRFSWTLMCLVAGVAAGCLMAWRWIKEESRES